MCGFLAAKLGMEELVRQYLESKGYHKTATSLVGEIRQQTTASRSKAGIGSGSGTLAEDKRVISALMSETSLTSEELVIARHQNEDGDWARMYTDGYDKYYSWAMSTLDVIKCDLLSICFPLFVQSYITLIYKECYDEARTFWDAFHQQHMDNFSHELNGLSMLTSKEQLVDNASFLESNPFVKSATKNKYRVRISNFAFNLLSTFLAQNDLLLSAAIINDRIQFERVDELQSSILGLEAKLVGYGAPNRSQLGQAYAGSGYGLNLAVPGKGKRVGQNLPDYRGNETYRTWLEFLVLRDAFNYAHTNLGNAGTNFFGTRSHQQQRDWKETGAWSCGTYSVRPENRADASSPSALFCTLTNVNDDVICMDINRSVNQAVAGCRDNCVRVWEIKDTQGGVSMVPDGGIRPDNPWNFEIVKPGAIGATYRKRSQYASASSLPTASEDPDGLLEFRGHNGPIYGVSQDKSSRLVLSGSADCSVRLWDKNLRQCVGKYNAFSNVWDVSFGPLSYYFATASMDRTVGIYSTDRVSQVRLLTGHSSDVTCVTWHDNATLLVSGSDDKSVRVWDINTGNTVRLLAGAKAPISSVAMSPVGDKLAAGAENGMIHVWDLASGKHASLLQGNKGSIYSLGFSSEGSHLVSGSADCSVRVWDLSRAAPAGDAPTGQSEIAVLPPQYSFHTKSSPVYFASFSPSDLITAGGPFNSMSTSDTKAYGSQKITEEVISRLGLSSVTSLGR